MMIACPIELSVSETWTQAFLGFARSYARSFWYVFRVVFPLMLVAALLGALVSTHGSPELQHQATLLCFSQPKVMPNHRVEKLCDLASRG